MPHAGGPVPNATFFCSTTSQYCYSYITTLTSYANAITGCASRGMALATYDSSFEQLQVETSIVPSSVDYSIGLAYASSNWSWQNGTALGSSTTPSNANPYAHWAQAANSTFGTSPTFTAVRAQATSAYGVYSGDGSTAQQIAAYYATTATNKTNGWLPTLPTGTYAYLCKGTVSCPPSPPVMTPPPPVASSLCG